jgi:glucose-6-phosphate isomerase
MTDVVNIGIGGSDLGPAMVCAALSSLPAADGRRGPRVHFVSNVDGAALRLALRTCDPATTLFIVASKTFTTAETIANAQAARAWLMAAAGDVCGPNSSASVRT